MRERHRIHPEDVRAIGHADISERFERVNGLFNILSVVGYFVGALVLMSGIIGISNIMVFVVKERTKELGVRKALGATPKSVIGMVLQESIFITTLSGVTGMIFGIALLSNIGDRLEEFFIIDPYIENSTAIVATVLLILFGAVAGYIPAKRAASIKPIVALRDE